jgi:hypothetical protein
MRNRNRREMLKMTAAFAAAASAGNLSPSAALGGSEGEAASLPPESAFPASRALTARQVRELLAASPAPDPEVARLVSARAYRLGGGEALLVHSDGAGRLYESRAALLEMMDAMAGGSLSFFADERDVHILLGRLNGDPDIAFIVPDGPLPPPQQEKDAAMQPRTLPPGSGHSRRTATIVLIMPCIDTGHRQRWRAVRPAGSLNDGWNSLWYIPAGPLPLLKADRAAPDGIIQDPWAGWTEERPACTAGSPDFGPASPAEIRLGLWAHREIMMTSQFYCGPGLRKQRWRQWWRELEGWFSRSAAPLQDPNAAYTVWALPSALQRLKEGMPYLGGSAELGESIRRAIIPQQSP